MARSQEDGVPSQCPEISPRHHHLPDQNCTVSSEPRLVLELEPEGVEAALPEQPCLEEETAKQVAVKVLERQTGGGHSPRFY